MWNALIVKKCRVEALTTMFVAIDDCLLHDKHSVCVADDKNIYVAVMRPQWRQPSQSHTEWEKVINLKSSSGKVCLTDCEFAVNGA